MVMLKLILFLVLPLIVCEATVNLLTMKKPPNFDKKTVRSDAVKKIYCDYETKHSMHCFTHDNQVAYNDRKFVGLATAIVYKEADCSDSARTVGVELAYLLMDSCEDKTSVHVTTDANQVEAVLKSQKWKICTISEKTCKFSNSATLKETKWAPYESEKDVDIPLDEESGVGDHINGDDVDSNKVTYYLPKKGKKIVCDKGAYQCLSCSSVRVCYPDPTNPKQYIELERHDCTHRHPYCNYTLGMCDSTPDPECFNPPSKVQSKTFYCMKDGFFPDPRSCNRFYLCKNNVAYLHTCPRSPVPHYHPRLQMCVNNKDVCTNVHSTPQCIQEVNYSQKVPVKETNNYFMVCGRNNQVLVVDRCEGAYYFEPAEKDCLFKCPYIGNFMSREACDRFIRCSPKPEGGFKMTDVPCPPGTGFSEEEFMCVDRNKVPRCYISSNKQLNE